MARRSNGCGVHGPLFEQAGTLYQLNDFDGSPKKNALSTGRTVPNTSELGTQYVQFGRFVIYVNGYDRPSKSHLWPCTAYTTNYLIEYPLGFDQLPPSPVVWNVETDATATSATGDYASIFFVGDVYQRAGNTVLSRAFAEKVAQTVPDNGCLDTLDAHEALLFHLGRPVEYIEVADANKFLQNPNHYLIVTKESYLQQIDKKLRRIIVSGYPYRNRQSAYLLQGSQLEDKSRLK